MGTDSLCRCSRSFCFGLGDMVAEITGRGSWWGVPFFGLWALMRWVAVYFNYGTLPELSLIPFFVGLTLFVGGWRALAWAWPAIFFLFFMIPLPGMIQSYFSEQLQAIATRLSVYIIQTIGIAAVAQGNVIQLTNDHLEIARACSGLRMMMLFFAICIGAAFIARKPLWERLLMVASAAPIAVASNVIRIVMTAILFELAAPWPSHEQIHNWAGYAMMPVGLLLLLVEMTILSKLLIEPVSGRPLAVGRSLAANQTTQAAVQQALARRRR